MRKLRTKSNIQTKSNILDDQPSTSNIQTRRHSTNSSDQHHSPESPINGRIAKNNAKILNGLDLINEKRTGAYAYIDMLGGILPDLKITELNDKFPIISKIFKNDEKSLDIDTLHLVQHELEELISQNVDYQKTIHGEITYYTQGEYPTIDLVNRPMPKYELIKKQEQIKLKERAKHAESTQATSLMDLGILSSPEDEDTPNILDVPNRFWNWAKEYLRPISKDYVRGFKERILDHFDEVHFLSKFCQQKTPLSPHKTLKRKANNDGSYGEQKTPSKMSKLSKCKSSESLKGNFLPNNNADEMNSNGKLCRGHMKQNGLMTNGMFAVGSRSARGRKPLFLAETPKKELDKKTIDEEESTTDDADEAGMIVNEKEKNDHSSYADSPEISNDEVSMELSRKQEQLKMVFRQTRPLIEELYEKVLKECAVHEVFTRLDSIDNSLYQMGYQKYERLHFFNEEQRQEVRQLLASHSKIYKMYHEGND